MENPSTKFYTLITGATAGIGKQIAIECAKRNLNLFLVSLPDSGLENFTVELKSKYSVEIQYFSVDLTIYEAPQMVFDFAQKNKIQIDILVNNAGVGFNGKFEKITPKLVDEMILLNIRASTLLTLLFLPEMINLDKAHILNLSSFAAFSPVPYKCVYAASKTYLFFLTRALNSELKNSNVKVTSVHPTGVSSERTVEVIRKSSLMSRISSMSPEQVAKTAVKNMLNGNKLVVPGVMSKMYYLLGSILPHGIVLRLTGNIFRKYS